MFRTLCKIMVGLPLAVAAASGGIVVGLERQSDAGVPGGAGVKLERQGDAGVLGEAGVKLERRGDADMLGEAGVKLERRGDADMLEEAGVKLERRGDAGVLGEAGVKLERRGDADMLGEAGVKLERQGDAGGMSEAAELGAELEFALLTDIHVSEGGAAEAVRAIVEELNQSDAEFVIFAGDAATVGDREELRSAKSILDGLEKPLFAIPGNHESTWNNPESYCFPEIFGGENFVMRRGNLLFAGIPSGPWFKMSDGYIRKSDLAWLDDALRENLRAGDAAIVVCHYPAAGDLSNASSLLEVLKKYPVKAVLSGHYHELALLNVNGIKNIVGRAVSTRHSAAGSGGYTLIRTDGERFRVWDKTVGEPASELPTFEFQASDLRAGTPVEPLHAPDAPLPPGVTRLPDRPERTGIMPDQRGGGFGRLQAPPAERDGMEYFCSWDGGVYCFDATGGQTVRLWRHPRGGGIHAPGNVTPVVGEKNLVFTAPDRFLTIIDRRTGRELLRDNRCKFREGLGGSADGSTAYAKTMDGELVVVDVDRAEILKVIDMGSGYDHTPVPPLEMPGGQTVLVGTRRGGLVCVDAAGGTVKWRTRLGTACVDSLTLRPDGKAEVVLIDGRTFEVAP